MITKEANTQRKAHRLQLPIAINIEGKNYEVLDWSTTGVGVKADEKLFAHSIGDTLEASLMLPTGESSVLINLQMQLRAKIETKQMCGFEITHIEEKNKRVLRHYATLAIEGNADKIEDLTADLLLTDIESPITEPIALTQEEVQKLRLSFRVRVILYTLTAIFLALFIIVTALYNYTVLYHNYALSTGNVVNYEAPKQGKVTHVFTHVSQKVHKGMSLFEVQDAAELSLLQEKKVAKEALKAQQKSFSDLLDFYKKKIHELQAQKVKKVSNKSDAIEDEKLLYERAKKLYARRLITFSQLNMAKLRYETAQANMSKLALASENSNASRANTLAAQLITLNEKKIQLQEQLERVGFDIQSLNHEIALLQTSINNGVVQAYSDGVVHSIKVKENAYVEYKDSIMLISDASQPYLLARMKDDDIINIQPKQRVIVYSKNRDRLYKASITAFGYSLTDTQTVINSEISQHEIPVRIDFDDAIKLDLNERFEVWVIRDSRVAYFLSEYFLHR